MTSTTYYPVDSRARKFLKRYNESRTSKWIPIIIPCRNRVLCEDLADEVCAWFDAHGYTRYEADDPRDDPALEENLDEPEEMTM